MTDTDWNEYVDKGIIDNKVLLIIANKIIIGDVLSNKEISIYSTHSNEIETLLKQINEELL